MSSLPDIPSAVGLGGGVLLAQVKSDTAADRWYNIYRWGKPRAERGTGVTWGCDCPSRQPPHCKHLRRLFAHGYALDAVRFTAEGRAIPGFADQGRDAPETGEPTSPGTQSVPIGRRPSVIKPGLYTIGYSSRSLATVLEALNGAGVTLLVDVRTSPSSRWDESFRKVNLAKPGALGAIEYRWMKQLGGYGDDGVTWPRPKDAAWHAGIKWLVETARATAVCVMCMERCPDECHRTLTILPDVLALAPDLPVTHLLPAPPSKKTAPPIPRPPVQGKLL